MALSGDGIGAQGFALIVVLGKRRAEGAVAALDLIQGAVMLRDANSHMGICS